MSTTLVPDPCLSKALVSPGRFSDITVLSESPSSKGLGLESRKYTMSKILFMPKSQFGLKTETMNLRLTLIQRIEKIQG